MMILNTERIFQMWQYQAGDRQLCLRSKVPDRTAYLDLVFEGVEYIALSTAFRGLELAEVQTGSVYELVSEGQRYTVVAKSLSQFENVWDHAESPFEQVLRRRIPEEDGGGPAAWPTSGEFCMVAETPSDTGLRIVDCRFVKWLDASWTDQCALIHAATPLVISPRYLWTMSLIDRWPMTVRISEILDFPAIGEGRAPSAGLQPIGWAKIFRTRDEADVFVGRYSKQPGRPAR